MTRIIYWDLETTGLNPFHDQIIEIAAVDSFGNSFESLVCLAPGRVLSTKVTELTGITNEMLQGAPSIDVVLNQFLTFIAGADASAPVTYMVGHNSIRFDSLFLRSSLRRIGLNGNESPVRHLDTMLLCQLFFPNVYSFALGSLCKYFSLKHEQAHRAMGDVQATRDLFRIIQRKCRDPGEMHALINF